MYGHSCWGIADYAAEKNAVLVDMRSDTLTKPSKKMNLAMLEAEIGDDVFGEDPTVKVLEKKVAALLGKEDAIFVATATMGNLIAVMNHCDVRGSEIYIGEDTHMVHNEQASGCQLAGVMYCTLPHKPDGTYDLNHLRTKLRHDRLHEPISKLVVVENTHGGKVLPQSWLEQLAKFAKQHNLKLHLDGARLWNAVVASKVPVREVVAPFDSVTFCLNKCLRAPIGSMLCGSREFIANARRVRKVLGGGMRQVGGLAAAGIVALDENLPLLLEDHRRARELATAISDLRSRIFRVDLKSVQTNMVFVEIDSDRLDAVDLVERLKRVEDEDPDDRIVVATYGMTPTTVRFVLFHGTTDDMLEAAIRKIKYVFRTFDKTLKLNNHVNGST